MRPLFRHLSRIGDESAQEPYCAELNSEAQSVVIATSDCHQIPIVIGEVEVAGKLFGRRLSGIPAVGAAPLFGE